MNYLILSPVLLSKITTTVKKQTLNDRKIKVRCRYIELSLFNLWRKNKFKKIGEISTNKLSQNRLSWKISFFFTFRNIKETWKIVNDINAVLLHIVEQCRIIAFSYDILKYLAVSEIDKKVHEGSLGSN